MVLENDAGLALFFLALLLTPIIALLIFTKRYKKQLASGQAKKNIAFDILIVIFFSSIIFGPILMAVLFNISMFSSLFDIMGIFLVIVIIAIVIRMIIGWNK